jgi:DNA (cytosine-5)-methyltransferase 1
VSKRNALGRAHGFGCETQGTLFFDLARIIAAKRPSAFLLENVRNLIGHDKGRTFNVIRRTLESDLAYSIHYTISDARRFVPQRRDRILIAGFREDTAFDWGPMRMSEGGPQGPKLASILHPEDGSEPPDNRYTSGPQGKVLPKYVLSDRLWQYLKDYARKHREKGNGFGYGLVDGSSVARTLSARYYKDGSEILVDRGEGNNPRRLTPRECGRLMGFPDSFEIPVSDTQAYRQFGNSVVVPAMREAGHLLKPHIMELVSRAAFRLQAGHGLSSS